MWHDALSSLDYQSHYFVGLFVLAYLVFCLVMPGIGLALVPGIAVLCLMAVRAIEEPGAEKVLATLAGGPIGAAAALATPVQLVRFVGVIRGRPLRWFWLGFWIVLVPAVLLGLLWGLVLLIDGKA